MNYSNKSINKTIFKSLNDIALPLLFSSIFGMSIGILDQMMVGRISTEAYAAIGIFSSVLYIAGGILGSISIVFNIRGSHLNNENKKEDFNVLFKAMITLSILLGIIFMNIILLFGKLLLGFYFKNEIDMTTGIGSYINIMSGYILCLLLNFIFSVYCRIKNCTKYVFYISVISSVINTSLDYVLIFGKFGFPELGATGAAIGSMTAMILSVIAYFILFRYEVFRAVAIKNNKKTMLSTFQFIFKDSIPFSLQEIIDGSLLLLGINYLIAMTGIIYTSAFFIVKVFVDISLMPMYKYGNAVMTIQGNKLYNDNKKKIPAIALLCSTTLYIIIMIVCVVFGNQISQLITNDITLAEKAGELMLIIFVGYIFTIPETIYKNALQALGKAKLVLYTTAIVNSIVFILIFLLETFVIKEFILIMLAISLNYLILSLVFICKLYNIFPKSRHILSK